MGSAGLLLESCPACIGDMSLYGGEDEERGHPAFPRVPGRSRDLCQGFRDVAVATWDQLGVGASVACQPSETTLTDNLLITLGARFRDRVVVRRTSQRQERQIGSDFEMRFLDGPRYLQLRLQAKRLDVPTQWYREFNKAAAAVKQARTLIAATPDWPALYCFYNHFESRTLPRLRSPEPTTWGVTLADARGVLWVLETGKPTLARLVSLQAPWHELVCADGQEASDLLGAVLEFLFDLPGLGWDIQPRQGSREANLAWVQGVDQVRDSRLLARVLVGRVQDL
jgi:hypothetical protein